MYQTYVLNASINASTVLFIYLLFLHLIGPEIITEFLGAPNSYNLRQKYVLVNDRMFLFNNIREIKVAFALKMQCRVGPFEFMTNIIKRESKECVG